MDVAQIAGVIRRSLGERGLSPFRAAVDAGLPENAIRTVLNGHEPKLGRLAEICETLGLELYVGPPRASADAGGAAALSATSLQNLERSTQSLVRLTMGAGGNPIPDDLRAAVSAHLVDPDAFEVASANEDDLPPNARSMGMREIEVAAGGGAVNLDEAPEKGRIWFRRDWLDSHGIDPTQCVVISVRGESMDPTLPDGCSILLDRSRTRRREGGIFVMNTDDGLIVKRLGKSGRHWLLLSDHPSWKSAPWPRGTEVVGEVRWASRTFR